MLQNRVFAKVAWIVANKQSTCKNLKLDRGSVEKHILESSLSSNDKGEHRVAIYQAAASNNLIRNSVFQLRSILTFALCRR